MLISKIKGLVFNIERYAINDGPGIRTLVFLKGCPLRCLWCCNPEGQESYPQLLFFSSKCAGCGKCLEVCPTGATFLSKNKKIKINRKICTNCGKCVEACLFGARVIFGKYMTVKEVMDEVLKDLAFYQNSGGGVTLSGGEVTMQPEFAREILKICSSKYSLNTAIETSGHCKWENLREILEFTDLVLFDLKHIDLAKHMEGTKVDNTLILKNVKKIAEMRIPMIIRVAVIPGYNDSENHMKELIEFVKDLKTVKKIHFLPYHELGSVKYKKLGRKYKFGHKEPLSDNYLQKLITLAKSYGIQAQIGG